LYEIHFFLSDKGENVMLQWFQRLLARLRPSTAATHLPQTDPAHFIHVIKPSKLDRQIHQWVDDILVMASDELDSAEHDSLFSNLFFIRRTELQRIELWLSACSSGCCCLEGRPESSILLSSFSDVPWERAWRSILNRLTEINHDRAHPFYHRILVGSYPEMPSFDIDHTLAGNLIYWKIRSSNFPEEACIAEDA
jgi:hypothetical protein